MKIPLPVALLVIVLTLAAVGVVFYFQVDPGSEPAPEPVVNAKLPYQTEEAWSVLEVAQTVADLAAFGAGKASKSVQVAETAQDGVYDVRTALGRFSLDVREGIWNPKTYSSLAAKAVGTPDGVAESTAPALTHLLEPGFKNLAEENRRISDLLTKAPHSATAHVQAALLLGTIGLNDHAGVFRDPRRILNRMTAHLALAQAGNVDESDPGFLVASALLLTLTGNQSAAVAAIERWPDTDPLAPWKTLLLLRNTGDWRLAEHLGPQTPPAVRNEFLRAMVTAITPRAALDYLREHKVAPDATLWRMFNEAPLGVELGHIFRKPMLEVELTETAAAAKFFGLPVSQEDSSWINDYLDTPAAGVVIQTPSGPAIEVAGRAVFADFHQRHLLSGISNLFSFLHDSWGVREQAEAVGEFVRAQLPDLRLKPFLVRLMARTDDARRAANPAAEAIIFEAPESVTPEMWAALRRNEDERDSVAAPDFHGWFSPEVPRQTAFETGLRLSAIGVGDENDAAWLAELWQRSPYDFTLSRFNAYLEQGKSWTISAPILDKWFVKILPYNVPAMKRRAATLESDPVAYAEAMEAVVRFDPDELLRIAAVAARAGRDDLRETFLLRAFEDAEDRVWMANESPWLVARLYETGRIQKAHEVADAAAEVYSYQGLKSALWLAEAEGRWKQAMEIAEKIDKRYNDGPGEQAACYLRMTERSPEEAPAYRHFVKEVFPDGVKKVALADFTDPPTAGVRLDSGSPTLKQFGLEPGQIVVALDGHRIESLAQYTTIRSLNSDPEMTVIAWDGQAYRELRGSVPGRTFSVEITTYRR